MHILVCNMFHKIFIFISAQINWIYEKNIISCFYFRDYLVEDIWSIIMDNAFNECSELQKNH